MILMILDTAVNGRGAVDVQIMCHQVPIVKYCIPQYPDFMCVCYAVVAPLWGWQCCYNLFASLQLLSEDQSPRSSRKRSTGADEARERMR
jgi:hypothetical protein